MQIELFNKHRLQNKLTFYPLLWFGIGLFATFLATMILIKIYLDSYLMNQTVAYTQQIAKDIVAVIEQDKETISTLVLTDTMRDLNHTERIAITLERVLNQNRNFLEGYVLDCNGRTLVGVSLLKIFPNGYPSFKKQYIYERARNGNIAVSGWENFTEKYRPYWYMAVPIEKYQGNVIGVLIVTINLRRISNLILTSQGARYGNPILLDRHGDILVHLNQSLLGRHWNVKGITNKLSKGEIGTAKYYDRQGRYVLAAYQSLNVYGWGLVVQIPPDQTIYIIRNKVILLFGMMTLAIFTIAGMLIYMAAGKIVAPIKKLTKASVKFGKGHQVTYFPEDGEDEIAELSTAFYDMELRINEFEKQRAQYISMIAHDLRNPFTSITEIFRSLQKEGFFNNDSSANLQTIQLKLEQVNRMILDLLDFSKIDLGQISFHFEMVSVKYLFEDVITGYMKQKNKFILKSFPDNICIWVDPIRLQQIIQNIFDNCLRYTPIESSVEIDCWLEKDKVQIEIIDHGLGIPEEIVANLFTPFQTANPSYHNSNGLGMSIAKKLALSMNGDLNLKSFKNKGTVVHLYFPSHPAEEPKV